MISPRAIKEFLARKTDSFDWIKAYTQADLDKSLAELNPQPKLKKLGLWLHQQACFLLIIYLKRFLLFIDMGGGKTRLSLAVIRYRKQRGESPRAIVFVPYISAIGTWIDEVEEFFPDLKCVPLMSTQNENMYRMQNMSGDLFVICYQSAVAMVSERVQITKKKVQWNFKAKDIRKYFGSFDMLIMDEIHKNKEVTSLTYRMCRAISTQCEWVFGLTGTPFGRDLMDLWAQLNLIDFGETLGPTLGFYREVFFSTSTNFWGAYVYKFKKAMMGTLKHLLKNNSIRYSIDEFYDMEPRIYNEKHVRLNSDIQGYYNQAAEKLRETLKDRKSKQRWEACKNAFTQMRQLSSGFMTFKGEDNDKIKVKFDNNPKLEALEELVDAMPYGCKMIVFHTYVYTNKIISDRLRQLKIGHARVWGGNRSKHLDELRRFKESPDCHVLLINDQSGSSSLNLQVANYVVFFEQPASAINREQAERRVWRPGQKLRVFITDLMMQGTYDARLKKYNKEGKDLLANILDGKEAT